MENPENRKALIDGLKILGIEASEEQIEKLIVFKKILLEWNEKLNLTAITDEKEIIIKHFLDSATCISTGYIRNGMDIIDVGTGAGFPGIPMKILKNGVKMTLLDSLNKRIIYLDEVIKSLGLEGVSAIHSRAEEAGSSGSHRGKYDIALSRAVASMNVLCEYCLPFVKRGGYFLCQKGPEVEEEMRKAEKAIRILGGAVREIKHFILPLSDIKHSIVIIEKISDTPTKYPRKPGKPSANPII